MYNEFCQACFRRNTCKSTADCPKIIRTVNRAIANRELTKINDSMAKCRGDRSCDSCRQKALCDLELKNASDLVLAFMIES